jgi:propanol-preferring alcohol dehydrogenase
MKAMVLHSTAAIEDEPLQWVDLDDPVPAPGQVAIQVLACGVCRSNLHMIEGDWLPGTPASMPIVPGHEVVGRVIALGEGVSRLRVGDRVGVQPIWSTCGSCEYCLSGSEQLCRGRQITGETRDGGYAERMLADADYVYPIPDGLSDAEAAPLLCPGVTAYGAVKKANLSPGQSVAVLGIGGVGHMVLQLARLTGADVHAVTRSETHRAVAEELGAVAGYSPKGSGPDFVADGALDAAIVFAPSATAVEEAMRITKRGGRIVLGVTETVGVMDIGEEKTVVGSVLGNRQDTLTVLSLAAAGKLAAISEAHPLADANKVLGRLKAGQIRARAVLVP